MQKFQPKVTIVIPVYNGANYLRNAIDSALSQTYPDVEVIVINDSSDDNGETGRIARSYGNKIRYFQKENGGAAAALNLGIEKMTGEYFSWLNHDAMYETDKIQTQVEILSGLSDKSTILLGGVSVVDEQGELLYQIDPLEQYSEKQLNTPLFALFKGAVHGCTLLVHKSHFSRAGRFDPSLPTAWDNELFFRIMRGQPVLFHPGIYVRTRFHQEQESKRKKEIHIEECSRLWISMMEALTEEEMTALEGSPYLFYRETREFLAGNSAVYQDAVDYADQKLRSLQKESAVLEEEYFYQKFSYLLYELTESYNAKITELENRCRIYEERLGQGKYSKGVRLALADLFKSIGEVFKRAVVRACRFIFGVGRRITTSLGIKDKLKKSKLFQKFYDKGLVDKLRNR